MSPRQYRGIYHALTTVFREEGPRALYRGWLPSVIGVVSEVFVYFCILYGAKINRILYQIVGSFINISIVVICTLMSVDDEL